MNKIIRLLSLSVLLIPAITWGSLGSISCSHPSINSFASGCNTCTQEGTPIYYCKSGQTGCTTGAITNFSHTITNNGGSDFVLYNGSNPHIPGTYSIAFPQASVTWNQAAIPDIFELSTDYFTTASAAGQQGYQTFTSNDGYLLPPSRSVTWMRMATGGFISPASIGTSVNTENPTLRIDFTPRIYSNSTIFTDHKECVFFYSSFCGDGNTEISQGEECDDGNNLDGDGCNHLCKIENTTGPIAVCAACIAPPANAAHTDFPNSCDWTCNTGYTRVGDTCQETGICGTANGQSIVALSGPLAEDQSANYQCIEGSYNSLTGTSDPLEIIDSDGHNAWRWQCGIQTCEAKVKGLVVITKREYNPYIISSSGAPSSCSTTGTTIDKDGNGTNDPDGCSFCQFAFRCPNNWNQGGASTHVAGENQFVLDGSPNGHSVVYHTDETNCKNGIPVELMRACGLPTDAWYIASTNLTWQTFGGVYLAGAQRYPHSPLDPTVFIPRTDLSSDTGVGTSNPATGFTSLGFFYQP